MKNSLICAVGVIAALFMTRMTLKGQPTWVVAAIDVL
jgi:hypothetical protein